MNDQPSNLGHQPAEVYPGHADEARKREQRLASIERGHAAVLPGALREAFAGEPIATEGHKL